MGVQNGGAANAHCALEVSDLSSSRVLERNRNARRRISALGLGGALFGLAVVAFAATSVPVLAGEGNSNYLGVLSSSSPSGYTPSPSSYTVGDTLSFDFTVKNLTSEQQSMSLQLNVNHILTYKGMDVSDGQPGVSNGAVVDGNFDETQSTQTQDANPTFTNFTIAPGATEVVHMSRTLSTCGYFQVDVAKAGLTSQKGLVGLEVRVLGCTTPVATPSPTGTGGGVTPTPSAAAGGAVAGTTATTTKGGSGSVLAATATASGVPLANTAFPMAGGLLGLLLMAGGMLGFGSRRKK